MQIPSGFESLTAKWLTDVLSSHVAFEQAQVSSFTTERFDTTKGALSEIIRLNLTYDANDSDAGTIAAPRSIIAKIPAENSDGRPLIQQLGVYEREIRFYRELAEQIALRTPVCYYSDINTDTDEFVLLLEDLAPARNGARAVGCSLAQAELAIDEIARFHAAWWEHSQLTEKRWLQSLNAVAVHQRLQARYQERWAAFLAKIGTDLPEPILALGERAAPQIANIFAQFSNTPQTLVHNDYMLDNIFYGEPGDVISFAVVDWQLLRAGSGLGDVGPFLGGNVSIADRRSHEMDLLRRYHDLLLDGGVDNYPFTQCLRDYRFSMFDGLFRMVVSIGGDNLRHAQHRAHRDIIWPRYAAALLDLNVAELLPG